MRLVYTIFSVLVTVVLLTPAMGPAQGKFKNKDTAKNRQDNTWGTTQSEKTATTTMGTNERGDTVIKSTPKPKEEPVDWYDKVIITVDPYNNYSTGSSSSSE